MLNDPINKESNMSEILSLRNESIVYPSLWNEAGEMLAKWQSINCFAIFTQLTCCTPFAVALHRVESVVSIHSLAQTTKPLGLKLPVCILKDLDEQQTRLLNSIHTSAFDCEIHRWYVKRHPWQTNEEGSIIDSVKSLGLLHFFLMLTVDSEHSFWRWV
jgi:hypothetical protein